MTTQTAVIPVAPWYRHRWPWLVMAGPAIVVVAGIITMIIAFRTSDGLVADDYYKEGLAINRSLERDVRARALGVAATATFNPLRTRVRLGIFQANASPNVADAGIRLSLLHPTRAGLDQVIVLKPIAPGLYEGEMTEPRDGLWHVQLEAPGAGWRLMADWRSNKDILQLAPVKE